MTASKNSVTCFSSLKGNSQFLFLYNPPKSNASRFHTKFPQKTKKILSTDTVYGLELITIILSILKIFSLKKTAIQFFNIAENLQENQRKHHISSMLQAFKSKLRVIHVATYLAPFFRDSNSCSLYIQHHISIFVSTIFNFFHVPFLTLIAARHILQFAKYD